MRPGASPNPAEQMKRGTPQMNNSGIPSPVPEGGQSRGSPNPAMNFMGNQMDPNMAPHFFKGMEGNMGGQPQMNAGMRPPSSHPGQPFNGQQMTPQMMAAARQQQQQQGQPGQGPQGNPQQWQQGPNGQMVPQQMQQQSPQIQGTPQQRSMPPPQAPPAGANGANRTTASPQQAAAAPPTPSQTNKAAPKKKESKAAKDKVNSPVFFSFLIETNQHTSALPPTRKQTRISTTLVQLLPTTTTIHRIRLLLPRLSKTPMLPTSTRTAKPEMLVRMVNLRLVQLLMLL
jgi:hypothetical protein